MGVEFLRVRVGCTGAESAARRARLSPFRRAVGGFASAQGRLSLASTASACASERIIVSTTASVSSEHAAGTPLTPQPLAAEACYALEGEEQMLMGDLGDGAETAAQLCLRSLRQRASIRAFFFLLEALNRVPCKSSLWAAMSFRSLPCLFRCG